MIGKKRIAKVPKLARKGIISLLYGTLGLTFLSLILHTFMCGSEPDIRKIRGEIHLRNLSKKRKCLRKCANKEKLPPSNLPVGKCSFTTGKFSRTWNASSETDFQSCLKAASRVSEETKKFASTLFHEKKKWKSENGVVFSSKRSQLDLVFTTSALMIQFFKCNLPIEVFVAEGDLSYCRSTFNGVSSLSCRVPLLSARAKNSPQSRFGWKVLAIMQSSFKNVLWLDTDAIPIVHPNELFQSIYFQKNGAVFWPDLTGVQCDPEVISMWPSGSEEGVLWDVFNITFKRDDWKHVQEMESGQMLIDTEKYIQGLHLAYFLTEHGLFQQFAYGDKEAFRWAWLYLNLDFHLAEYPALSSYHHQFKDVSNQCYRIHYLGGKPVFLHGKKRSRNISNCGFNMNFQNELKIISIPRNEPPPKTGVCIDRLSFKTARKEYVYSEHMENASEKIVKVEEAWERSFKLQKSL